MNARETLQFKRVNLFLIYVTPMSMTRFSTIKYIIHLRSLLMRLLTAIWKRKQQQNVNIKRKIIKVLVFIFQMTESVTENVSINNILSVFKDVILPQLRSTSSKIAEQLNTRRMHEPKTTTMSPPIFMQSNTPLTASNSVNNINYISDSINMNKININSSLNCLHLK